MAGREFARRAAPDDLKSFEYARADGSIRTMHPRDGWLSPQDAEDEAALDAAEWIESDDGGKLVAVHRYDQHEDDVKAIEKSDEKAIEKQAAADQSAADEAAQAAGQADGKGDA